MMFKFWTALVGLFLAVSAVLVLQSASAEQMYEDSEDAEEADFDYTLDFTPEAYDSFRDCLCEGESLECRAIINQDNLGWTITDIYRNGSFNGYGRSCNFYACQVSESFDELVCRQTDSDIACGFKQASEYLDSSDICCEQNCQRLFWTNPEGLVHFNQTQSDTDKCKAACSCSSEATTDQTPSEINGTTLFTGVIQVSNNTTVSTESTMLINITELVNPTLEIDSDDKTNSFTNMTADKFTDNSDDIKLRDIIIVGVALFVIIIALVLLTVYYYSRRKSKQNVPTVENGKNDDTNIDMAVFGSDNTPTYPPAAASSSVNSGVLTGQYNENYVERGSGHNNVSPAGNSTNNPPAMATLEDSNRSGQTSSSGELGVNGPGNSYEHTSGNNEINSEVQSTHRLLPAVTPERQTNTQEDEYVDLKQPLLSPTDAVHHDEPV